MSHLGGAYHMEERQLIRATPAARLLAKRMDVKLQQVTGTGYKGRIHKEYIAGWNFKGKIHISPLAQRIADEHNIDLSGVKGTGHNEKIMKDDVVLLISDPVLKARLTRDDLAEATEVPRISGGTQQPKTDTSVHQPAAEEKPTPDTETIPMTMMRKIIAKRMSESYFSIPSFVQNWEIDMTELLALRKKLIDPIKEKTDKKLTVTDLISFAVVNTLIKHKYINASLNSEGTEITFHNYVNLAIAVGMEEGLLVPVVKNADKMSLSELVVALKDVTERTLNKKLLPDEQTGSTFTISNLGMYGVESFTAIINQPNAAILSVSSTQNMPVAKDGQVVIRPIMKISLTSDHRIIDGLAAAKFMQDLKQLLESPLALLI